MGPQPSPDTLIELLRQEMDDIHHLNTLYWKRASTAASADRIDYEQRLARLEEIRSELVMKRALQFAG